MSKGKNRLKGESSPVSIDPAMNEDMARVDGKRHFDTLMEAESIKQDPMKMKHIMKHLKLHKKAFNSIQDLKDKYASLHGTDIGSELENKAEDKKEKGMEE